LKQYPILRLPIFNGFYGDGKPCVVECAQVDPTGAPGAEVEAGFLSCYLLVATNLEKVKISGLDFCRFSCGVYPNDFEYFVEM